jgi:hypothetical protein
VAPWDTTINVPNGSYTLYSVAFNSSSQAGFSSRVSIIVNNLPTTSVIIPKNGATLQGTTTLDASASSNAQSVSFFLAGGDFGYGQDIANASPTPYGWVAPWDTTINVPNGSYTLYSVAFNSSSQAGFSSRVSITVNN